MSFYYHHSSPFQFWVPQSRSGIQHCYSCNFWNVRKYDQAVSSKNLGYNVGYISHFVQKFFLKKRGGHVLWTVIVCQKLFFMTSDHDYGLRYDSSASGFHSSCYKTKLFLVIWFAQFTSSRTDCSQRWLFITHAQFNIPHFLEHFLFLINLLTTWVKQSHCLRCGVTRRGFRCTYILSTKEKEEYKK